MIARLKNFLFAGGERAAAAYTLIETAKSNGCREAYLREVIGRIAVAEPSSALLHRSASPPDLCCQFGGRTSGTSCASLVSE
jgi:hypothetical protein